MLTVTLLGTAATLPQPDRALSSAVFSVNGRHILLDCGEGTQIQMRRFGLRFKPIEAIAVTHFHADYTAGLPGDSIFLLKWASMFQLAGVALAAYELVRTLKADHQEVKA